MPFLLERLGFVLGFPPPLKTKYAKPAACRIHFSDALFVLDSKVLEAEGEESFFSFLFVFSVCCEEEEGCSPSVFSSFWAAEGSALTAVSES